MNKQLIEKVIRTNDGASCPAFTYDNPLLDRTVAQAFSKSLVKILRVSQQNSNINNNLRHSVLGNIRKMCCIQPVNHMVDETTTHLLTEVYSEEISRPHIKRTIDPLDKTLDDFLVHYLKEYDVNSSYQSSLNPEVAQSLVNLNVSSANAFSQRILDLDSSDKGMAFLKCLWTMPESLNNICDISLRMKPEIEKKLLEICEKLLKEQILDLDGLLSTYYLNDLIEKCSVSPECFQICSGILNDLFHKVNFSLKVQLFITEFVNRVKKMSSKTISVLYPSPLSYVVVLLDCNVTALPEMVHENYIKNTLPYINKLQEPDLVMLLSHYPDWFDIYFNQ